MEEVLTSNVNWSNYQERQLNTFVDMGFMTKIEDNENEDEMGIEVAEDNDMFNEDDSNKSKSNSSKKSSSS